MRFFRYKKKINKTAVVKTSAIFMAAVFVIGGIRFGMSSNPEAEFGKTVDEFYKEENLQVAGELESLNESDLDVSNEQVTLGSNDLDIKAKSAVLMDVGTKTVLYEQNGDEKLPPASITKIMTMLLSMEAIDRGQISLEDQVVVSDRAASMGGSQMYMESGETHTVEELMKGICMVSANDGAVAMAEYLCGSVEIFVEKMNARAKELGMLNTHFVNTNGLPVADHYTSAKDIAIMGCELMKHEKTHEWMTKWQDTVMVGLEGKQKEFGLTNTNKLIKQYHGANGIKTGFTQEAGYCLAGSATREDMTLVAVVLGCEDSKVRFAETGRLLDYGFANYDNVFIAEKGESNGLMPIEKGRDEFVDAVAAEDICLLVKKGQKDGVRCEAVTKENLKAPIKKGDTIGEIVVYMEDKEVSRYPLVAAKDVEKANIFQIYKRMLLSLIE